MQPAEFEYHAPSSLSEAAALLAKSDGAARVLNGGQSLVAAMNLRLSRPSALVDLRNIPGLDRIEIEGNSAVVGARVTHAEIIRSTALRDRLPILAQAGAHIAHSTIREKGTLAGSLALADPASEWAAVFLALGGHVKAVSVAGERRIGADDFFISHYSTALTPDEIISHVELPLAGPGDRFGFCEFSRQTGAFALALAAARVRIDARGRVSEARVVLGGCGGKPRLIELAGLVGSAADGSAIDRAVDAVTLPATGDIHASSEDRQQIASTMLKRCVRQACLTP
jgi:CO/xanthine dehydrogenase FAD-binding subunit